MSLFVCPDLSSPAVLWPDFYYSRRAAWLRRSVPAARFVLPVYTAIGPADDFGPIEASEDDRGDQVKSRASFEPAYVPCSTYRLQLNLSCTFLQASSIVPYLYDLGITDCYTSPFLMARPGSQHGYDVTDHTRFNPEIGSEEEFAGFAEQLGKRGMGLVIDVVPNHMCITHPSNLWWWDVLENGPSSDYCALFRH